MTSARKVATKGKIAASSVGLRAGPFRISWILLVLLFLLALAAIALPGHA